MRKCYLPRSTVDAWNNHGIRPLQDSLGLNTGTHLEGKAGKKGDEMENKAHGETILNVEDDTVVGALYQFILECNGYRVINAVDGEDGINKFIEHQDEIQLLITDVIMPKKNGKALYEEIKKIKNDVKVIFTSGYDTELTKELQSWGMAYLQKPYPPAKLLAKIKDLHNDILTTSRQVLWN